MADRFGRFNVIIVFAALSAILVLALWIPARGDGALIAFAILYGFASGAYVSMGPAVIAQISDIRQIGVRSGTMFAIIAVSALTGSPIGGALVTKDNGEFLYLQIFCGVTLAAGAIGFFVSRTVHTGLKWKIV